MPEIAILDLYGTSFFVAIQIAIAGRERFQRRVRLSACRMTSNPMHGAEGYAGTRRHRNDSPLEHFHRQQKDRLFIRQWLSFATCVLTILMIVVAIKEMFAIPSEKRIFLCAYAIFFGVVVLIFEFMARCTGQEIEQKKSFGFMFTASGRTVFFGFMGLLCLGLGLWGMFMGGLWFLYGFLNYFIIAQLYSAVNPYMHIYDYNAFASQKKHAMHHKGEEGDIQINRNQYLKGPLEGGPVGKGYSV